MEREIGADEIRRQLHNENILDLERKMKENLGLEEPAKPAAPNAAASEPEAPDAPAAAPSSSPSSQDKPTQSGARANPATRACPWSRT